MIKGSARKDILENCPDGFKSNLEDFIDNIESDLNDVISEIDSYDFFAAKANLEVIADSIS